MNRPSKFDCILEQGRVIILHDFILHSRYIPITDRVKDHRVKFAKHLGPSRARRPSARRRPWPRAASQLLKFHPARGLDRLPRTAGGPRRRARRRPWPRAAGQLLKFHPARGLDRLPQKAAGLAVVRDAGPGRARRVSFSRSIQLVGWTVCLGRPTSQRARACGLQW